MAFLIAGCTGCISGTGCGPQPKYAVRRSALVSHPAPPARSGAPLRKDFELRFNNSTVVVPVEPVETPGANAGLYVARHNFGLGTRFKVSDTFDFGFRAEASLLRGSMAIAKDRHTPPTGSSVAFGPTFHYSAPLGKRWYLGFALDLAIRVNPIREDGRCIHNCQRGSNSYTEEDEDAHLQTNFAVLPSYRFDRLVVFGGVSRRNHPTNEKNGVVTGPRGGFDDDGELTSGPVYLMLGGGVEVDLGAGFKLMGQLFQPVSTSIASYGPVFGLAISIAIDGKTMDWKKHPR